MIKINYKKHNSVKLSFDYDSKYKKDCVIAMITKNSNQLSGIKSKIRIKPYVVYRIEIDGYYKKLSNNRKAVLWIGAKNQDTLYYDKNNSQYHLKQQPHIIKYLFSNTNYTTIYVGLLIDKSIKNNVFVINHINVIEVEDNSKNIINDINEKILEDRKIINNHLNNIKKNNKKIIIKRDKINYNISNNIINNMININYDNNYDDIVNTRDIINDNKKILEVVDKEKKDDEEKRQIEKENKCKEEI